MERLDEVQDVTGTFLKAMDKGESVSLATIINSAQGSGIAIGVKLLVWSNGKRLGGLGDPSVEEAVIRDCLKAIESGKSSSYSYPPTKERGEVVAFIEVAEVEPALLVMGAGHIAQPLVKMAKTVGFHVTVLDDRPDFASKERFPEADRVIAADFAETLRTYPVTGASYLVLVTRGHKNDEACLRQVINSPAAYIGMIGSRRRVKAVFMHLEKEGTTVEALRRVHAPIGLDIHAETPEEIAISIVAELVQIRHGGTGHPMSEKEQFNV